VNLIIWSNVCVIWVSDPMVVRGWRSLNGRSLHVMVGTPVLYYYVIPKL
jgi:hypothetical protein